MRRSYRKSSVVKDFGQFVVTKYGVECSETYYPIAKEDLADGDWVQHMSGKAWVWMSSFTEALAYARKYHAAAKRPGRRA